MPKRAKSKTVDQIIHETQMGAVGTIQARIRNSGVAKNRETCPHENIDLARMICMDCGMTKQEYKARLRS
jgi:hypothetical protein